MDNNNIIRVLVAEDESLILKNTIKKIEQISPDFQVVGSAYNGQDALRLLANQQPHILFTDIKMPTMDGLELIRQTREKYPHILIVIISGYEDFEYARKAIQYGVVDYLLKPIKMESLKDTLLKLQLTIQARKLTVQRTVLTSQLAGKQADSCLPFDFSHKNFMVFLLCTGNLPNSMIHPVDPTISQSISSDFPFGAILNDCIPQSETWWLIDEKIANQKFLILCTDKEEEKEITELAAKLQTAAEKLPVSVVLTISLCEQFIPFGDIWNTAQNLRTFLYRGLVIGHAQIITAGRIKNADPSYMDTIYANKFRTFANSGNVTAFIQLLQTLFSEFNHCCCPQYLMEKSLGELLNILRNAVLIPDPHFQTVENKVYEAIRISHTIPILFEKISSLFQDLFNMNAQQNSQILTILDEIENYFIKNYAENINLDNIAKRYGFNTSYLARNFKKVKGESPIKYILKLRMEEAKVLLTEHPDLSIKEISELVGYSDQHYFSRFFRDAAGISPSEYRVKNS